MVEIDFFKVEVPIRRISMIALKDYYKQPGVVDLMPLKKRLHFAKALMIEDEAGGTTPEAEEQLNLALAFDSPPDVD